MQQKEVIENYDYTNKKQSALIEKNNGDIRMLKEQYQSAIKHYMYAIKWLKILFKEKILSNEKEVDLFINQIGIPCYLNISICHSHKEEWKEVVTYTTILLEIQSNNKKALYYRILANQNLKEFEKSLIDLEMLEKIRPPKELEIEFKKLKGIQIQNKTNDYFEREEFKNMILAYNRALDKLFYHSSYEVIIKTPLELSISTAKSTLGSMFNFINDSTVNSLSYLSKETSNPTITEPTYIKERNNTRRVEKVISESFQFIEKKNSNESKLIDRLEKQSTQIQLEQDLQEKHKREISELTIKLRESSERYDYLEGRYESIITNNNLFSNMVKELKNSVEEKEKKINELERSNQNALNKTIKDLMEKNATLELQLDKTNLINTQNKENDNQINSAAKRNSNVKMNHDHSSNIFKSISIRKKNYETPNNENSKTASSPSIITGASTGSIIQSPITIKSKNDEAQKGFDITLGKKKANFGNVPNPFPDNGYGKDFKVSDLSISKIKNDSDMTSDESLDKNEREKIMNDIKSNYDNVNYYSNKKLDKFSNYKKLRKDGENSLLFKSWNVNNFISRKKSNLEN